MKKLFQWLSIPILCCIVAIASAETINTAVVKKVTVLTADDAVNFIEIFGEEFNGGQYEQCKTHFSFQCHDTECRIASTTAGFRGEYAESLLKGSNEKIFESQDKKFKLHCGRMDVAFCNVSQRDAILR